jgi:hypothetical protein
MSEILNPAGDGIGVIGGGGIGAVRFIKSDGGPHAAATWGTVTTDTILDLIVIEQTGSLATINALSLKQYLRERLQQMFTAHYHMLQQIERLAIIKLSPDEKIVPDVEQVYGDFQRLMAITPLASHFARDEVGKTIRRIIGQHSVDVIHIERRYHADKQGD